MKKITLGFFVLFTLLFNNSFAQLGSIDPSYGVNGFVTNDFGSNYDWARDILLQPDGKIILLGQTDINSTTDIAMARLNSDGTPDLSFNSTGISVQDLSNSQELPHEILLQPDGKILVCGKTVFVNNPIPTEDFFIARFNADGTPDLSFNNQGFNSVDFGNLQNYGYHMALDASGRIVLVGMGYNSNFTVIQAEAYRFNNDGSKDTTFAISGNYIYPQNFGEESTFRRVAVQNDGKIVISGRFKGSSGSYDALVIRLKDDGSPDSTFSSDGLALIDIGSYDEEVTAMQLQPDGKILIAGRYQDPVGSTAQAFVCRVLPNGSPDVTFGTNAISLAQSSTGFAMDYITDMVLHPNGNIFLGGYSTDPASNYSFSFFGFNDGGAALSAFGNNGSIVHPYQSQTVTGTGMAMQADFKIVACGIASPSGIFGSPSDFISIRIIGDMTTSSPALAQKKHLEIYPNPAKNQIFFPAGFSFDRIEILDVNGLLVSSLNQGSKTSLDLSHLNPGCYTLRCTSTKEVLLSKFIKQ